MVNLTKLVKGITNAEAKKHVGELLDASAFIDGPGRFSTCIVPQ